MKNMHGIVLGQTESVCQDLRWLADQQPQLPSNLDDLCLQQEDLV